MDQIGKLMTVPWQDWPLWKQVLLVLILAAVAWAPAALPQAADDTAARLVDLYRQGDAAAVVDALNGVG